MHQLFAIAAVRLNKYRNLTSSENLYQLFFIKCSKQYLFLIELNIAVFRTRLTVADIAVTSRRKLSGVMGSLGGQYSSSM